MSLETLEATLKNQQFVGGQAPTQADVEAFNEVKSLNISPETHPYTFGWFCLIWKFNENVMKSWPAAGGAAKGGKTQDKKAGKEQPKKEAKKEEPKKEEAKKDDDDLDLFGEDEEDESSKEALKKAKEDAEKKKKPKKEVIAMSLVFLEVKPLDDTTNLDDLAKKLYADIVMEGLFWKTEYKKVPVAYGIFKLIVAFSCEDEKVSVDDVVEKIEALEEFVQSVEIQSFNKI